MLLHFYTAMIVMLAVATQFEGSVDIRNSRYFDCNGPFADLNLLNDMNGSELKFYKEGDFDFLVIQNKKSANNFSVIIHRESFDWMNDSTLYMNKKREVLSNPCVNLAGVGNHSIVFNTRKKIVKFYYNDFTDAYKNDSLIAEFIWQ